MKKVIILLVTLTIGFINVQAQKTVTIFNAKLKAKDINPQDSFFHPNYPLTSRIVEPEQLSQNVNYWIGKIFTKNNLKQNKTFLDLGYDESYFPLLDSIDMDYYSSYSLNHVLDKKYGKDANYLAFRKAFKEAKNCKAKKELLIGNIDYADYFFTMNRSKLDNIEPTTFTNTSEVENQIKLGLKANLDKIFNSTNLKANAKLKAEIDKLIEKEVSITGTFHLVGYKKEYLSKVITYLKYKYEPNIDKIKALTDKDQFTSTLINFYDERNSGLFVGAVVLSIEIEYNISKISKSGIEAILKVNGEIPAIPDTEIINNILASFSFDKKFTGEAKTTKVFCISYAYDSEIETFGKH
jgi:hypothetical protein